MRSLTLSRLSPFTGRRFRPEPEPAAPAPAAEPWQPSGRHARRDLPAITPGDRTPDYDATAHEGAERRLLMPLAGPPWAPAAAPLDLPASLPDGQDDPDTTAWDQKAHPDLGRSWAPENGGAPDEPAVLLRAVALDGSGASVKESVTGFPAFLGPRQDGGTRYVGIGLGVDEDTAVVLDATSAEWLDELITAAQRARDHLVYGGFRQQAPPPPSAAGPVPPAAAAPAIASGTTEARDYADGVLHRAYRPEILDAVRDDAGFGDAGKALAGALKRYDAVLAEFQPGLASWHESLGGIAMAALEYAARLTGVVRKLCGDSAADYLEHGTQATPEVPAEAVTAGGGVPVVTS